MPVQEGEYCGCLTAIEEPGILVVTFNRPESLNASTAAMKRDLVELLTQAQMDDAIRIVVFTGQGQAVHMKPNVYVTTLSSDMQRS